MSSEPPEISILDRRLAEIDRRLSTIQNGLLVAEGATEGARPSEPPPPPEPPPPARPPEPPAPARPPEPPAPARPPEPPPPPRIAVLPPRVPVETAPSTPSARPPLAVAPPSPLEELRRLVHAQEEVLASTRELLARLSSTADRTTSETGGPVQEFSVSAGPFTSTEAVRAFERMLERIPEVREVEVRGYEGEDRAIVDVRLFDPKP